MTGAITERLERRLVLDLAGDVKRQRILDVGCGDGVLAIEMCERDARVVGIDTSEPMIDAAVQRARDRRADVTFILGNAKRLPFASNQFDLVTAITILCFVEDASAVFDEIARVLRPGGRLVIGELGRWSSWAAARRVRAWLGSPLWQLARFRTSKELRALAQRAGLEVIDVRGAVYYPRLGVAARLLARCDGAIGRVTTLGAAFIAIAAVKR